MLAMCDQSSGDMPRKIDVMVPMMPLAAVALMRSRMSWSALENRADEAAEVVGEPAEILAGAAGEAMDGGAVHGVASRRISWTVAFSSRFMSEERGSKT